MRSFLILLGLLLAVSPGRAQSISLPPAVQQPTPGLVVIRALSVDADAVVWWCVTPGVQVFPADLWQPPPGVCVCVVLQPGNYVLGCAPVKVVKGKAAVGPSASVTVSIGTPPGPTDPLAAAVQAAYAADTSSTKSGDIALLAQLYSFASQACQDQAIATWSDLSGALAGKSQALGVGGHLAGVQQAIAGGFLAACPTANTLTNPVDRAAGAAFWQRASIAAGGVQR